MNTLIPSEYCLGPASQIPIGEGREFLVGETKIAVFRSRNGGVYATQPLCPHRAGPLVDGLMGGNILACPLHAWKFDLSTGQPVLGDCGLTTYPARVTEEGDLWVEMA
ncbi:MAG: Nitrite reductase small subunit, probable [Capsulimonas sp.]|jgi:nitrite reductase (NADH) small subunit|nr:Nitrite reductase small subunit, probable [Capsulimonas sp.]